LSLFSSFLRQKPCRILLSHFWFGPTLRRMLMLWMPAG
jgi:hypothetical protein